MRWLIAAVIVLLCSTDLAAQPRVIDGDTLVINGTHYRIEGIDAPEQHQLCRDGWTAGLFATQQLRAIVRYGAVCTGSKRDKYGRTIALCTNRDGEDVGYVMVRSGFAYAYTHYSKRYVVAETQAESEGLGVHWHGCEKPWVWRKEHK